MHMTKSTKIDSISSFFEIGNYKYRIFDMGHSIQRLSTQQFKRIENQQEQYPLPFQQQAWLGILFWHPETKAEPIIWFIRLPIDEVGLLKLETRDSFIQQIIEQVGERIKQEADKNQTLRKIEESPFAFKPNQEKMAMFNALAKDELKHPASKHYEYTTEYLDGQLGYDQWTFLGLQGIADVIVRLDNQKVLNSLVKSIPLMPPPPLSIFCQMLEHSKIPRKLSTTILARLSNEIDSNTANPLLMASFIRALSSAKMIEHRDKAIAMVLTAENNQDIEILAAIASRAWNALNNKTLLKQFLEALSSQTQEGFNGILLNIMTIPTMQKIILDGLRNPDRSKQLERKVGEFMKRFR